MSARKLIPLAAAAAALVEARKRQPGAAGDRGLPGLRGLPGRSGADGKRGRDGQDGAPGRDGKDGKDGKDGAPSLAGKDGAPGRDGVDGIDGRDGKDGGAGPRGPMPRHRWQGSRLQFEEPDGSWSKAVELNAVYITQGGRGSGTGTAMADDYSDSEQLATQTAGAGGEVLTFTFAEGEVQLIVVHARGADGQFAYVDHSGIIPADGVGRPAEHNVPTHIVVKRTQIRVWAPAGMSAYVEGYRR